jgi:hypothetical protein
MANTVIEVAPADAAERRPTPAQKYRAQILRQIDPQSKPLYEEVERCTLGDELVAICLREVA